MKRRHLLFLSTCLAPLLLHLQLRGAVLSHHPGPNGRPVWTETFDAGSSGNQPDPAIWGYEQGGGGWGNGELETYCAWGESTGGCDPSLPNAFVGVDKLLHIVARRTPDGHFTSARLISRGKKEFKYGRIEVRARIPLGQGIWPAFWMMGADSEKVAWPACGEIDVMENLGREPMLVHGTIHGKGFPASGYSARFKLPDGQRYADGFHTYGVLWAPGRIAFYVDDPGAPYAVYTPRDLGSGAIWPFDSRSFYLLLNVAVGGGWPGPPDAGTRFPAEMLIQTIRAWDLDR